MIIYDIKLYDMKTDTVTLVLTLPERRRDYDRPRGRTTIEKWTKSLLGDDWWLKNWHNITIIQRSHDHWRANGRITKRGGPRPPKRGGVE